jgi:hypothetical protein
MKSIAINNILIAFKKEFFELFESYFFLVLLAHYRDQVYITKYFWLLPR